MSQGPLCPNLSQKVQKEVFQMANHNLSCVILLGGLSVNLNHLKKRDVTPPPRKKCDVTPTQLPQTPPPRKKHDVTPQTPPEPSPSTSESV